MTLTRQKEIEEIILYSGLRGYTIPSIDDWHSCPSCGKLGTDHPFNTITKPDISVTLHRKKHKGINKDIGG